MRFQRRLRTNSDVNLVPMIDVVFQLVIFFMVSTTFSVNPGISLALPDSTTAEPVAMTKLVVSIISEEEIYLNQDQYNLYTIDNALASIGDETQEEIQTVVVEGDKNVSYELMIKVLDVLRKNNFKGMNLRTRPVVEE